ncbi:MAG: Ada metal-binding domain-containing protein, partial [Sphingomonadaceae bacterium]
MSHTAHAISPLPAGAPEPYASAEQRWAAVQQRAAAADGVFWYSVRSTGVYCRPSCGARPALRHNVAFHDSCAAAEAARVPPSQRCHPGQPPLAPRPAPRVAPA